MTDQLRQSFAQFVFTQRGDKLTIPLEEVMEARIYSGVEGVRLGLVDAIGSDTDAIKKAADLAGVSGYDLVDVNTEVARIFNQKLERILEPVEPFLAQRLLGDQTEARELMEQVRSTGDLSLLDHLEDLDRSLEGAALRTLPSPGGIGADPQDALPNLPVEITGPNVYYLYTGPTR